MCHGRSSVPVHFSKFAIMFGTTGLKLFGYDIV
jgi:hypothetical protein